MVFIVRSCDAFGNILNALSFVKDVSANQQDVFWSVAHHSAKHWAIENRYYYTCIKSRHWWYPSIFVKMMQTQEYLLIQEYLENVSKRINFVTKEAIYISLLFQSKTVIHYIFKIFLKKKYQTTVYVSGFIKKSLLF